MNIPNAFRIRDGLSKRTVCKKDGLYGYVDQNGETVVDCQYKNMQYFTGPIFLILNPVF